MSKYTKAIRMLARMKALDADSADRLLKAHAEEQDGGPGSGNFGHKGRPGKRGGSSKEGGSSTYGSSSASEEYYGINPEGAGPNKSIGKGNKNAKVYKRGPINPKDYPEIFPGGKPAYTRKKHGVELEGVSISNGYGGQKYIEYKWSDGNVDRKTLEEAKQMEHRAYELNKRLERAEKADPFEGMSESEKEAIYKGAQEQEQRQKAELESRMAGKPSVRWSPDPIPFRGSKEQAKAHYDLENNMVNTADWCFEEKNKFPKDSIEYREYEKMEDELATHEYRRPAPEDSARMIQKRLSNVSKQLKPYAVERYKKDLQNEPQITKDVCDIADALGIQMHGLEYRTKTAGDNEKGICRIQQKIEQDLAEDKAKAESKGVKPTLTYEECVDNLNDLVRYTQMSTEKNLVDNYEKTRKALEDKGYKVVKVKNFYNVDPMVNPYRGLTCVFESPTGTKFEFQFHTPRSLVAKNAMHPIYEIDRNYKENDPKSTISKEEHERLQERMRNVSNRDRVPYPVGIEKIQGYPPKNS